MTEKSKEEIFFNQEIQQVVFPADFDYEDLNGINRRVGFLISDYFAVRTNSDVAIVTCSRTEDKYPSVHHCLTLPSPLLEHATSKYIVDTAFASTGSPIATITDQGYWTVYQLSNKKETADVMASGTIALTRGDHRNELWKMQWTYDSDGLVIAQSNTLYYLNVHVSRGSISS